VKGLIFPVAILLIAELAARTFGIASDTLAPPSQILVACWSVLADGTLFERAGQTVLSALGGLAIGGGLGLLLALVLGLSPTMRRLLRYPIETLRPIPSIATLPIVLMIYGFGYRMEIAIVAFACFWPVLIIGQAAIGGIEPRQIEVSRVLGMNAVARATKIVLPAAMPRLFIAFRQAAAVSLIVSVTVEIAMNPQGLGYALMDAQNSLRPAVMFAMLIYIGLIGWTLNSLLLLAQKHLFSFAATPRITP
jgi:NitT/TauT family transport system permease protein